MTNMPVETLMAILALAWGLLVLAATAVVGISRLFNDFTVWLPPSSVDANEISRPCNCLVQKLEQSFAAARSVPIPLLTTRFGADRSFLR